MVLIIQNMVFVPAKLTTIAQHPRGTKLSNAVEDAELPSNKNRNLSQSIEGLISSK